MARIGETLRPMVKQRGRGYVIIEGTKEMKGRGWYYDYIVIHTNGDVEVGSEEGNYAGGIWLTPATEDYTKKLVRFSSNIMRTDREFYDLINQELARILKEWRSYRGQIK